MRAVGFVRKIDNIWRIGLPKEIRCAIGLKEGDPMEIFMSDNNEIILKKYCPEDNNKEYIKEFVKNRIKNVKSFVFDGKETILIFKNGRVGKSLWNEKDPFDLEVGIYYAMKDAGYTDEF